MGKQIGRPSRDAAAEFNGPTPLFLIAHTARNGFSFVSVAVGALLLAPRTMIGWRGASDTNDQRDINFMTLAELTSREAILAEQQRWEHIRCVQCCFG
jgi:hypothetical protein